GAFVHRGGFTPRRNWRGTARGQAYGDWRSARAQSSVRPGARAGSGCDQCRKSDSLSARPQGWPSRRRGRDHQCVFQTYLTEVNMRSLVTCVLAVVILMTSTSQILGQSEQTRPTDLPTDRNV